MASELRVTASVKVNRPLIEVFDKVCYLEHAKDWVPFCVASEMIAPSTESEHHNGIGRGMVGLFEFALGPALRLKVPWGALRLPMVCCSR